MMPIYEFKCLKCNEVTELIVKSSQDQMEMVCSKCGSEHLERVISTINFSMGGGARAAQGSAQTRSCGSGSCTTYDIPGASR
jgi:putative FmdB family regulatory protein